MDKNQILHLITVVFTQVTVSIVILGLMVSSEDQTYKLILILLSGALNAFFVYYIIDYLSPR